MGLRAGGKQSFVYRRSSSKRRSHRPSGTYIRDQICGILIENCAKYFGVFGCLSFWDRQVQCTYRHVFDVWVKDYVVPVIIMSF